MCLFCVPPASAEESHSVCCVHHTYHQSQSTLERQSRILALTQKKKWDKLMDHLDTPEGEEDAIAYSIERSALEWNILHTLCWSGAPVNLIKRFTGLCPNLVSEVDLMGRTPLHISLCDVLDACVAKYLLTKNPYLATVRDKRGKTPLMYACDNAGRTNDASVSKVQLDLIRTLLETNPSTVLEEDNDGVSPIESAICNGATADIVGALQTYAIHTAKKQQRKKQERAQRVAKINRVPQWISVRMIST
uniref:Uncharacterized protein n=1 Tax=Pseudictyota dubia TaxID=2749911 RepID=A0A7R9VUA4_9STRA|mmetsp:Transcript_23663/g.43730  ORF Transcript_23663/g.43730 Transcript_23663/m.43730 type:complete len:248 (+) Transcript_23663:99-842(+)